MSEKSAEIKSIYDVIEDTVKFTPDHISNLSIEEKGKHFQIMKKESDKFINDMSDVIYKTVGFTPDVISDMSMEELNKHIQVMRKKNQFFRHILTLNFFKRKRLCLSESEPRGSRIAAHKRFILRSETNKKIKRLR